MGIADNTLVLFTSDGGHLWGEHGLIDKRCAYEESIRIPLLATCPSLIAPATQCDALVSNIDVAPTILALLGLPVPLDMDGRVATELIDPEFWAEFPIQHISTYETDIQLPFQEMEIELDDDDLNELKALGYIE